MSELKTLQQLLGIVLLVAVIVGTLGYGIGRFVTPPEQITTTTTTTQVSTSVVTVTERYANTVIFTTTLPQTLPPLGGSRAVIRSFLLLDARVLARLSIDKSTYTQGEIVHIKANLTNLTPDVLPLKLTPAVVQIKNSSSGKVVWMYPESGLIDFFGPPIENDLELRPGETVTLDRMAADWNMTGIHVVTEQLPGAWSAKALYDGHLVPAGQYTLVWPSSIGSGNRYDNNDSRDRYDQIDEKINFTITAKK